MATDEELRSAWTRIRRQEWPDTFDACMDVPMIGVQVRIEACRKRHYQPPPARVRTIFNLPTAPAIDIKRRASGEKDDD